MKFIYIILLTTTTAFDGHPFTRGIGVYPTPEACQRALETVKDRYERTFPEGVVSIRNIRCDRLEVPDNYNPKKQT